MQEDKSVGKQLIDSLLERTVVPSFSSLGTTIRSRLFRWQPLESYSLRGQVVVISGATSGIGEAAARRYAQLEATLVIIARNPDKTRAVIQSLKADTGNEDIHGVLADLGDQNAVRRAAQEVGERWPAVNVLVHNAGALYNQRKRAANDTDLSVELMVATPFLLTGLLLDNLKAASHRAVGEENSSGSSQVARVLTMSSGGMYTQGLTVDRLQMRDENYQGAKQYARAKRAQVVLNELWADRIADTDIVFHALHPGWVQTPGISDALPGFSRLLGPLGLLRSGDDGADTLVWLSVDPQATECSGAFWHDRKIRSIDMSNSTRSADTEDKRRALWQWCEQHTNWFFNQQST